MALTKIEQKKVYAQNIALMVAQRAATTAVRDQLKAQYSDVATQIQNGWQPVLDAFTAQITALRAARDAITVANADRVAYAAIDEAAANAV